VDDGKLLTLYVRDGSEAAFGQIVTRHRALVYATCLREIGSPSQAEDAAQVVFLLLSRKSKRLRPGPSLAGWLFRTARFVAKDVRKQESRRSRREEIVFEELAPRPQSPAPEWQRVEPLLNGALSALRPADRELILLRFLEGLSLSETGAALGLSEDAARMRVTRAVEKMRRWLKSHGASVTSIALTGLLTAEAARPIPARAAEALPSANVLLLSKGVSHTMKIVQVKAAALVTATLVLGAATLVTLTYARPPKAAAPAVRQAALTDTPQTVLALLNKAQAAADRDKTLTADFSYVVNDAVGGLRKDSGTVRLMKPNYAAIAFDTGLPTATEIHSDGQTLWTYHPATHLYEREEADPQGKNINVWRLITVGGFFSVYTWVRQGIYADPSELHYRGKEIVDGVECDVLEHLMTGHLHGKPVPFDQKVFFGPDGLIRRFTLDFTIDGKPGTEYADLTNIRLGTPMLPADFAYAPPVGASPSAK